MSRRTLTRVSRKAGTPSPVPLPLVGLLGLVLSAALFLFLG
jgi:hypothetical protein